MLCRVSSRSAHSRPSWVPIAPSTYYDHHRLPSRRAARWRTFASTRRVHCQLRCLLVPCKVVANPETVRALRARMHRRTADDQTRLVWDHPRQSPQGPPRSLIQPQPVLPISSSAASDHQHLTDGCVQTSPMCRSGQGSTYLCHDAYARRSWAEGRFHDGHLHGPRRSSKLSGPANAY